MIGNISMEEFARKVYMETGVRPQYNSFALYHNTVYICNIQLGKLYMYGTINCKRTIKEVRKGTRISIVDMTKGFVVIFNHDTQKIEIYCNQGISNLVKSITNNSKITKLIIGDDHVFFRTDTAMYFISENGAIKRLGALDGVAVSDMHVKDSTIINGYEIYAGNKLVYVLDKHLNIHKKTNN